LSEDMKLISMDTIEETEVAWLWYPYIPAGKITILQGDPGEGKTMLVLYLAALLTQGLPLPEQERASPPMTVIYQTAEDGLADTIKPRLKRAFADCSRVVVIDDSENPLSFSDERIEQAIVKTGAKLLILDPLQAFLGAKVDMHRANEVRPAFRGLAGVAERTGCAVVIIGHLNKMSGTKGIYRGLGSIDIPAVARSILYIGRASDDDEKRYMAQMKNSLAPMGETLAFELQDRLIYAGVSDYTAEHLLSGGNGEFKFTKRNKVMEELAGMLDKEEIPCVDIYDHFKKQGISARTVENAKQELGVKSVKRGGAWYWQK